MAKSNNFPEYPIFYKNSNGSYIAVFAPEYAFEIKPHGHGKSDGYEFNVYRSRAKVRKLESTKSQYTPEKFYEEVFSYMKSYIDKVKTLTILSLPNLKNSLILLESPSSKEIPQVICDHPFENLDISFGYEGVECKACGKILKD